MSEDKTGFKSLSPGQQRIVELLCQEGLGPVEIGVRLFLSPSTVSSQLARAKLKVGAKNVYRLISLYWEWRSPGDREFVSWGMSP